MRDKLYLQSIICCAEVHGRILINLCSFPGLNKMHTLYGKTETGHVLLQRHYLN